MSENLSDAEWRAEQTRRYRRQMDDLDRQWERSRRRVLGFIPGELWDMWPMILVGSVAGGLLGVGILELLVHHLELIGACRHLG